MSARSNLIGRKLADRFEVGAVIGEGAMAAVYRGRQDAEPREVALKVMHPHLTVDRTFVARFKREARAAAQIDHPNSVRILDWGVDGHVVFIAMELLAGRDLFDALAVEGPLPSARAARIMIQVAGALVAAHARGIVHRDLKPENIMLVPDPAAPDGERVKVLDFGIAKILERDAPPSSDGPVSSMASASLTTVGMLVGTPGYMSPEQCRGDPIDARSDVFASGVVLYQMLTRRLPFDGDSIFEVAQRHEAGPPDRPTKWVPTIDRGLERLVLRAMATSAADRHASAAELKEDLERVLARPEGRDPPGLGARSDPPTQSFAPRPAAVVVPIETLRAPSAEAPTPRVAAPKVPRPAPPPAAARTAAPAPVAAAAPVAAVAESPGPADALRPDVVEPVPSSAEPDSVVTLTRPSFVMPEELLPAQAAPEAPQAAQPADADVAPPVPAAEREPVRVELAAPIPSPGFRWDPRMLLPVIVALVVGMALGGGLVALLLR